MLSVTHVFSCSILCLKSQSALQKSAWFHWPSGWTPKIWNAQHMPALCIFCTNAANAFFFGCIVATCCKGLPIWELVLEIVSVCCFHFSPLSRACDICDEVEVFNVGRLRYFKHVIPNVHRKPLMNRKKSWIKQFNSHFLFLFFSLPRPAGTDS